MEPPENPVEAEMRRLRGEALKRHARAVDAIFEARDAGGEPSPEPRRELRHARDTFEKVRPYGWRDAEAAYLKDTERPHEAATGRINRAVRALPLETEIRIEPQRRADRFVQRWRQLDRTNTQQYRAGDYAVYRTTRAELGEMARNPARDPQVESILATASELGITFETGRSLGRELAFSQGIDFELGRSRGLGI